MENNVLITRIQKYLKIIEDKLISNKNERKQYLEEYEAYLLDSFKNKYQENISEENLNAFISSLDPPEQIANEYNQNYTREKKEAEISKTTLMEPFNILLRKFVLDKPLILTILTGFILFSVLVAVYNAGNTFHLYTSLILILIIFITSYWEFTHINKSESEVTSIFYVFISLTLVALINTVMEFRFISKTGKNITQYFGKVYEPLGYQSVYEAFPYHAQVSFNYGTELSPYYVFMVLILIVILSILLPITQRIIKIGLKKNQKRYYLGVFFLVVFSLMMLHPVTNFMNSTSFQPVKQIEGEYYNFVNSYYRPIYYANYNGTMYIFSSGYSTSPKQPHDFNLTGPAWLSSENPSSSPLIPSYVYRIGYDNAPLFKVISYNTSNKLSSLQSIIPDTYEPLPSNFPTTLNLNLSITINQSIINNYPHYYFQNTTNKVILYQNPYYIEEVTNHSIIIDKVFDVSTNTLIYYTQGNRTRMGYYGYDPSGFGFWSTKLYQTYNSSDLQNEFTIDIMMLFGSGIVALALLFIFKKYKL